MTENAEAREPGTPPLRPFTLNFEFQVHVMAVDEAEAAFLGRAKVIASCADDDSWQRQDAPQDASSN
jgi:hypothetical protein